MVVASAMHPEDPQFTKTLPSHSAGGGRAGVAKVVTDEPSRALIAGDFIGRYRIRERVGEGGMGVVYAAEDPELGRVVAIKLLRPVQGAEAEEQQRRMLREAQALARLSHRNLVMVFDVGSLRGRVWIAMEYVVGDTLEVWLAREHRSWSAIVDVFVEAGRGLAAVHAAGLVHRDFKPGNVIVRSDGTVQILDFGLAARAGEHDEDAATMRALAPPDLDAFAANLTKTGGLMGTPAYMAPEQFLMQPMDGRADQFGFCIALYESLYGHRPFNGKDLAQLMAATMAGLKALPAEIPGLPLAVRQVIARGLAPDPANRYADMDALLAALVATRSPKPRSQSGGWRRFALGMIAGGGALAIAVGVWVTRTDEPTPLPDDPPTSAAPPEVPAAAAPLDRPAHAPEAAADVEVEPEPAPTDEEDEPYFVEPTPVAPEPDASPLPVPGTSTTPTPTSPHALPSLSDLADDEVKPEPAKPTIAPTTAPADDGGATPPSDPGKPSEPATPPGDPGKPADPPPEPANAGNDDADAT